jgi:hypothetical protein
VRWSSRCADIAVLSSVGLAAVEVDVAPPDRGQARDQRCASNVLTKPTAISMYSYSRSSTALVGASRLDDFAIGMG